MLAAYLRRQQWDRQRLAVEIVNTLGDAWAGTGRERPEQPARPGQVQRSRSGQTYVEVPAGRLLASMRERVVRT